MNPFHGRHFQGEIILWAVRWYCKYGISYRELQEMLAEVNSDTPNNNFIFSIPSLLFNNLSDFYFT